MMTFKRTIQDKNDACGILCIAIVYLALFYSDYAFLRYVIFYVDFNILKCLVVVLYETIIVFIFWSHWRACGDPGVWKPMHNLDFSSTDRLMNEDKDDVENDKSENWSICKHCETYRPPRTHHCSVCRICIVNMDHHCPWVNNCIGAKNQKFFLQFLFYVGVLCVVTLISIFFEFLDVNSQNTSHIRALHCIILLVESLLFGIFVIAVFTDQLHVLRTDESTIDRYKNIRRKRVQVPKKQKNTFRDVCGRGSMVLWLIPINTRFNKRLDNFIV